MRSLLTLFTYAFILTLSLTHAPVLAQIAHLELGAANYGTQYGSSNNQFRILEETMTDLIKLYGPEGIVYLNDIDPHGLNMAVKHLNNWLARKGLQKVQLIALPGNYNEILLPKVKSAHLSNPGFEQVPLQTNSKQTNIKIVRRLEKIAHLSHTGLKITSYLKQDLYEPIMLIKVYASSTIFEQIADSGYEYYVPAGEHWRDAYSGEHRMQSSHTRTYYLREKLYPCEGLLNQITNFWLRKNLKL